MAKKNIGELNAKVTIETAQAAQDLNKLSASWNTYKAAQESALKGGSTNVNASALNSVLKEQALLRQITGGGAGAYDPSRLDAFSSGEVYSRAALQMRNLGNTADDSLKPISRFQLGIQNSAYQVQDLAVQLVSGQSAVVAFSQQLPQLTSGFGGKAGLYGSVIGVGIAMAGLVYKLTQVKKETEETTIKFRTQSEALKELNKLTRERIMLRDAEAKGRFAVEDEGDAQKKLNTELDKQKRLLRELNAAQKAIRDYVPTGNAEADAGAQSFLSIRLSSAQKALEQQQLTVQNSLINFKEKELEVDKLIVAENEKAYEQALSQAEAQRDAASSAYERFLVARKENQLAEMTDDQKLDQLTEYMRFLEEIGAKETEQYEIAKKRAREIGTVLLSASGATNTYLAESAERSLQAIMNAQSRLPQQLNVTTGANALGGMAGNGASGQVIDIQKGILDAVRQLVTLARLDSGGSGVN